MPSRYEAQSAEDFARDLNKAFIIVQADGSVDECSDDPVYVAIMYDESGYGPHTASLCVEQAWRGDSGGADTALQCADEMHEEWLREHYSDHLEELMEERLAEHVKDYLDANPGASNEEAIDAVQEAAYQEAEEWFRETTNGFFYKMSAGEFVAVLDSSTSRYVEEVRKGVTVTRREDCEEVEEVEDPGYNVVDLGHPRTSSARRSARRRTVHPYQPRQPLPKGFRYSITYEVVTEESAAEGDFADSGYEEEDEHADTLEDLASLVGGYSWIEDSGNWISTESQQDFRSGDYTSYDLHVTHVDGSKLSSSEYRRLKNLLGVR
jgi:hypothetical protein